MSQRSVELVPLPDVDEVVGVPEIQFGEDFGLIEGLKGGIDEWKGVLFSVLIY